MSANLIYDMASNNDFSKTFTMPKYSALYVELKNSSDEESKISLQFNGSQKTIILLLNGEGTMVGQSTADKKVQLTLDAFVSGYKLVFITGTEQDILEFTLTAPNVCMDIQPSFCQTTGVSGQIFIWDLDLDENGEYEDAVNCQYYSSSSSKLTAEIPILNKDAFQIHGNALFVDGQSKALRLVQYKYGVRDGKSIDCNGEGELESCTVWRAGVKMGECE
jgi:hypothetical protein